MKKAREQLVELQRQLGSQEKEKVALTTAQSKLKISQKKVENLTWEVEVLDQKLETAIRKKLQELNRILNINMAFQWLQVNAMKCNPNLVTPY